MVDISAMKQFFDNMLRIKGGMKGWEKSQASKNLIVLREVKDGIRGLFDHNDGGIFFKRR